MCVRAHRFENVVDRFICYIIISRSGRTVRGTTGGQCNNFSLYSRFSRFPKLLLLLLLLLTYLLACLLAYYETTAFALFAIYIYIRKPVPDGSSSRESKSDRANFPLDMHCAPPLRHNITLITTYTCTIYARRRGANDDPVNISRADAIKGRMGRGKTRRGRKRRKTRKGRARYCYAASAWLRWVRPSYVFVVAQRL